MQTRDAHHPVLYEEVLEHLIQNKEGRYIDATFGRGGHSKGILKALSGKGFLLAIDRDPDAVKSLSQEMRDDPRFAITQGLFSDIRKVSQDWDLFGRTDGVLLDLGVSSPQLNEASRGFSFLRDGPLDMRMDPTVGLDAATWINDADEAEIATVLKTYGEERYAKRIARAIVRERNSEAITTTGRLASIIAAANPAWEKTKHPATRSFQAIRIFINDELNELKACLAQCLEVLGVGGRLAVISFHSLEDRTVKHFFRHQERGELYPSELPITKEMQKQRLRRVGKAIKPSANEISVNPRARSAIMRIAEKIR